MSYYTCAIKGCKKAVKARGWCCMHYARWLATGSTYRAPKPQGCSVEGCSANHYAKGYCRKHYGQFKRGNRPQLHKLCLHCNEVILDRVTHADLHFECLEARAKDIRYKREYGIKLSEYEELKIFQQHKCAICFKPSDDPLHVDHDHYTGFVRGLLCGDCNRALGLLKDNIDAIEGALGYMRMWPTARLNLVKLGISA